MPLVVSRNRNIIMPYAGRPKRHGPKKEAWMLPSNKILLALQYWSGDKVQAMRLARFIADLEPGMCQDADFLLVNRFDTRQDAQTIEHVSRKFHTHAYRCPRRGTGWPVGCNELWAGTMEWVHGNIQRKKCPAYKAVLTFEADCVPMQHGWIKRLSSEWDAAKKNRNGALAALGAWLRYPGPHINGNGLFSGDPHHLTWFTQTVSKVGSRGGWDYVIYPQLEKRGALNTPLIRSYWNSPTMNEQWFHNEIATDAVFIHGIKDDSLLNLSRKRLLGK